MSVATGDKAANHRLLIVLNRLCAVLSIGAAILLYTGEKSLGIPGLAAAPWHEPIIVHCLLTAGLLFWANAGLARTDSTGVTETFVKVMRFLLIAAFAGTNLWLAGNALANFSPGTAAATLLAIPGVMSGWTFLMLADRSEDEEPPAEEPEPDGDVDGAVGQKVLAAAELSRATPGPTLRAHLLYGLLYVVFYGIAFLILAVAIAYYYLIEWAIFDQQFRGWPFFFGLLPKAIGAMLPYFLALAAVMLGLYAFIGIPAAVRERRDQRRYKNLNRDLTPDELALIERVTKQLTDYIGTIGNKWLYNTVAFSLFILSLGIAFGLIVLAIDNDAGLGSAALEASRTQGLAWYIYLDEIGAGDLLLFLSAFLAALASILVLGTAWRKIGLLGILDFRKNKEDSDDPWGAYRRLIALDVRRGTLAPGSVFDPAQFIHNDFKRFARGWYWVTAAVFAINLLFLYLDRMNYDLLTEDYIEYTDYWTSKVHRMGYGDVGRVEVACALEEEDDDKKRRDLELRYRLKFGDNRTIDVVSLDTPKEFRNLPPKRLDAWTRVDAKLRGAGVPVRHEMRKVDGRLKQRFVDRECRAGLDNLVGSELRRKVMPLLRPSGGGDFSG